jgi:voltage-gated potassium channel
MDGIGIPDSAPHDSVFGPLRSADVSQVHPGGIVAIRDRFTAFIDRHEIAWELGMGFLAVIYVAAGFALDDPAMVAQPLLPLLESALTVVFVTEFVSRFAASRDRARYLRGHWVDVLALLPVARGLRIARLLRVLRLTRLFAGTYRSVVRAERMRGAEGIALIVVGWSAVTVICCLAMYAVEGDVNPAISSPFDALWWGVSTLSTVGYGDVTPVTPEGKLVASALMVLGIGLFGALTAIVTNTLVTARATDSSGKALDDLERLAALRADDIVTAAEFETSKARLLARV